MVSLRDHHGHFIRRIKLILRGHVKIVKIQEYFVNEFTEHLNSIDENIKFTTEPEMDDKLPFLASCTTPNDDGSLDLSVYRKSTHRNQ